MVKKVMAWLLIVCLFLEVTINDQIFTEAAQEMQTQISVPAQDQNEEENQKQDQVMEEQPEEDSEFEEDDIEDADKNTKKSKPAIINAIMIDIVGEKITVTWKTNAKVDGYQIQYSKNAKFKKGKGTVIKKTPKQSFTINSTKKNKYYIRVRTYKKKNGKYVYGDWSGCIKITR